MGIAVKCSMDAIRAANQRINGLDQQAVVQAVKRPDRHRGWLEEYLIRARRPEDLPDLAAAMEIVVE